MTDYTPDTEEIRNAYASIFKAEYRDRAKAEFDRWLNSYGMSLSEEPVIPTNFQEVSPGIYRVQGLVKRSATTNKFFRPDVDSAV